jgi:hypothetical protein
MNLTRPVAIGVGVGALVTWMAWAAAPAPRPYTPPRARARAVEHSGAELAREVERLHDRLRPETEPSFQRNVFAFRGRARRAPELPTNSVIAAPPAPRAPDLRLDGMAEDDGPGGPVRTAVIAGANGVYLVKEGDVLLARYRVERLSDDAADLRDVDSGVEVHLVLR